MPDKSVPDLKKKGSRKMEGALPAALQPWQGVAVPALWPGASPGSSQEETRLHMACQAAGQPPVGY